MTTCPPVLRPVNAWRSSAQRSDCADALHCARIPSDWRTKKLENLPHIDWLDHSLAPRIDIRLAAHWKRFRLPGRQILVDLSVLHYDEKILGGVFDQLDVF